MTATEAAAAGQVLAESLMVDTCTITRGGTRTFNSTTGTYSISGGTTVYTGKCRMQMPGLVNLDVQAGEQQQVISRFELQVPMSVTGVKVGDDVHMDASEDPALVERDFTVTGLFMKTHATKRRIPCEEVS